MIEARIVPPQPQRVIHQCGNCPNYRNGGGPGMFKGAYCLEKPTGGTVTAFDHIPAWCPLEVAQ